MALAAPAQPVPIITASLERVLAQRATWPEEGNCFVCTLPVTLWHFFTKRAVTHLGTDGANHDSMHYACLDQWLQTSVHHNCPHCRIEIRGDQRSFLSIAKDIYGISRPLIPNPLAGQNPLARKISYCALVSLGLGAMFNWAVHKTTNMNPRQFLQGANRLLDQYLWQKKSQTANPQVLESKNAESENAKAVAEGLRRFNEDGLLSYANRDAIVASGANAVAVADGLLILSKNGLLTGPSEQANRDAIVTSGANAKAVAGGIFFLSNDGLLTQPNRDAIVASGASGANAESVAIGLLQLSKQGLLTGPSGQVNRNALVASGENAADVAYRLKVLVDNGLLTQANFDAVIANPLQDPYFWRKKSQTANPQVQNPATVYNEPTTTNPQVQNQPSLKTANPKVQNQPPPFSNSGGPQNLLLRVLSSAIFGLRVLSFALLSGATLLLGYKLLRKRPVDKDQAAERTGKIVHQKFLAPNPLRQKVGNKWLGEAKQN